MSQLHESIQTAVATLQRIEQIMKSEDERNWIRGVRAAIAVGQSTRGPETEKEVFEEMKSLYRTMVRGPGGFEDYFVWREDLTERRKANEELAALKTRLWELFGS